MSKLQQRILKEQKRRNRRQKEGKVSRQLVKVRASAAEQDRVTAQHAIKLLTFERTICDVALQFELTDADVAAAIRATLQGLPPSSDDVQRLVTGFEHAQSELGCDDDTVHALLRVIYRSLTNHSKCRSNEISYLNFASAFIREAGS